MQDRKLQDGDRLPILCHECEHRLCDWEKRFAREVLRPVNDPAKTEPVLLHYGEWFPRLAASLVWRTVVAYLETGTTFRDGTASQEMLRAIAVWKDFIMSRRGNPGKYELHVWALNVTETSEAAVFYRDHIIEILPLLHERRTGDALVLVKLPRLVVEGVICRSRNAPVRVTRMKMRHGVWSDLPPPLPPQIRALMNQHVREVIAAWNQRDEQPS